ncbi:MAG: hypothetical protein ACRD5W_03315 [Candidatus Acidiferrales bacterium]
MLKRFSFLAFCLLAATLTLALAAAAAAQPQQCAGSGSAGEIVESLIERSRKEIKAFRDSGGKPENANHPAIRWSAILWSCREAYPGTPAASEATAEAVHILIHAAHARRAMDLADSIAPSDAVWEKLLNFVAEAANETRDYRGCVQRIERLLPSWQNAELRARAQLVLAEAYGKLEERERAAALYQTVQREAAGTPQAERAAGALRQLRELNPGQPAPAFQAQARNGSVVSLAGFADRAVVLIFWSTT